jgi:hypothetical protein
MKSSDQINELAAAFAKAQGAIEGAIKDRTNPHFKSQYADLASVWDACRQPLSANGLAIAQGVETDATKVTVTTRLMHASGQWMESAISSEARDTGPQAIGSCVTYLRRYSLSAMVGVAPEDDDGNEATRQIETRDVARNVATRHLGNGTNGHAQPPVAHEPTPWEYFVGRVSELQQTYNLTWPDRAAINKDMWRIIKELGYPANESFKGVATDDQLRDVFERLEAMTKTEIPF